MLAPSDESLMEAVRGEQSAMLDILVQRYERPLYAFIVRMLGGTRDAEDVFQEVFLRIHQKRATYRPGLPFRPWLYRICVNLCRDFQRRGMRRFTFSLEGVDVADPAPGADEAVTRDALADAVRRAVDRLPQKQREVFILHQYQHMPYPEIAETLGIPLGTVKSRMHHAVSRLAEFLRHLQVERV